MNQLGQIIYILTVAIGATQNPGRITMPTEVRCDDVVLGTQFLSYPVPIVAVVTVAMN